MQIGAALSRIAHRRPLIAWFAGALVAVGLLIACDRFWLWPLVRHVVASRSGRAISFQAMRLGLDSALNPKVEFDGLEIDNAAWARSREPLIRAGRVVFELNWESLRMRLWIVERMTIVDGQIDIEQLADGRRNTRLSSADGLGRPRATLRSIDARRTRLHLLDELTGLDLRIESMPLAAPVRLADHDELPLTRQLRFDGTRHGTPFHGEASVSDTLTLQHTGTWSALQGNFDMLGAHLSFAGLTADILRSVRLDVDLRLVPDPNARPLSGRFDALATLQGAAADAHVVREGSRWTASKLSIKAPGGDLAGAVDYRQAASASERGRLSATLDARRLDIGVWRRWLQTVRRAEGPASAASGPMPVAAAAESVPTLPALDADLDLRVATLVSGTGWSAHDTRLHASLERARLRVALAETRIASGHGTGELLFDSAASPAEAQLDLHLTDLRLDELPLEQLHRQVPSGRLGGSATLTAHGRSVDDLLASARGTLRASLEGATVSKRLEAEAGLDGLALLRSMVGSSDQVPVRCAELLLELRNGRGSIRQLAFDTPRTSITGRGGVDLAKRTLDVVLAPSSNVDALLVLPKDIRIHGPIAAPTLSLQARGEPSTPLRCGAH